MNTARQNNKIISIGERMQNQLPEPLTPSTADLSGFEWVEFNYNRMTRSDLWFDSTGDEFKAWFALWMFSQGEVPAGSLPNNERRLASIVASCGIFDWAVVKKMALHGWVLCSDNRYYHPVIAEAVNRAWVKRQEFNQARHHANERKRQQREQREAMFAALRKIGVVPDFNIKMDSLRSICKSNNIDIANLCHSDKPVTNVKCHSDGHGIDLDLDLDLDLDMNNSISIDTPAESEYLQVNNTPPATQSVNTSKSKTVKGSRLPTDWKLPTEYLQWTQAEKPEWVEQYIQQIASSFADYWHAKAGKDAVKIDWFATWRNWVRNQRGFNVATQPQRAPQGGKFANAFDLKNTKWLDEVLEEHRQEMQGGN